MNKLDNDKGVDVNTITIQNPTWIRFNDLNGELVRKAQAPVTRTEQIEILMLAYSKLRYAIGTLKEWKRGIETGEQKIAETNINTLLKEIDLDEGVGEDGN